jgi:hypothetical protein
MIAVQIHTATVTQNVRALELRGVDTVRNEFYNCALYLSVPAYKLFEGTMSVKTGNMERLW